MKRQVSRDLGMHETIQEDAEVSLLPRCPADVQWMSWTKYASSGNLYIKKNGTSHLATIGSLTALSCLSK